MSFDLGEWSFVHKTEMAGMLHKYCKICNDDSNFFKLCIDLFELLLDSYSSTLSSLLPLIYTVSFLFTKINFYR